MRSGDIHQNLDEYVLGNMGHEDTEEVEEHLRNDCKTCSNKIARLTETLAKLGFAVEPVEPPDSLLSQIFEGIKKRTVSPYTKRTRLSPMEVSASPSLNSELHRDELVVNLVSAKSLRPNRRFQMSYLLVLATSLLFGFTSYSFVRMIVFSRAIEKSVAIQQAGDRIHGQEIENVPVHYVSLNESKSKTTGDAPGFPGMITFDSHNHQVQLAIKRRSVEQELKRTAANSRILVTARFDGKDRSLGELHEDVQGFLSSVMNLPESSLSPSSSSKHVPFDSLSIWSVEQDWQSHVADNRGDHLLLIIEIQQ